MRIPERRDRLQSKILVIAAGTVLAILGIYLLFISGALLDFETTALTDLLLSLTFGLVVWVLGAATSGAALAGAIICLIITLGTSDGSLSPLRSGLCPLVALFVLTFAATRLGRARKVAASLAEPGRERNAAQVVANLGMAGLVTAATVAGLFDHRDQDGALMSYFGAYALPVLLLAALTEATADTVSSEVGQAFGGTPILLTTGRKMRPGTNGAITLIGTLAGLAAALLVTFAGMWGLHIGPGRAIVALTAGVAGLFFDSFLGATVERRGWLGNDLVNFASTAFAVLLALLAIRAFR